MQAFLISFTSPCIFLCCSSSHSILQVGNCIELEAVGLQFEPYLWLPCGVTWDSSQTVVVIKLHPRKIPSCITPLTLKPTIECCPYLKLFPHTACLSLSGQPSAWNLFSLLQDYPPDSESCPLATLLSWHHSGVKNLTFGPFKHLLLIVVLERAAPWNITQVLPGPTWALSTPTIH